MALIYIVEDDENIREIETIALKNSNYMVCAFEKAKDLYKKIDEIMPDLVLLVLWRISVIMKVVTWLQVKSLVLVMNSLVSFVKQILGKIFKVLLLIFWTLPKIKVRHA